MSIQQFEHAREILELLENDMRHMDIKWQLYQSIGYLPETNVFKEMLEKIDRCQIRITGAESIITEMIQTVANNKATKLSGINDPVNIAEIPSLRDTLYYDPENISDILNALNYAFLNRLVGVAASEPTMGTEIASRQFGGIQLIYNATESLMKDYVESIENMYLFSINAEVEEENLNSGTISEELRDMFGSKGILLPKSPDVSKEKNKQGNWVITDSRKRWIIRKEDEKLKICETIHYKGIVVFGFRNRAITYPPLIVHPSYAEHDLEYLIILAHEAYHLARRIVPMETADKLDGIERKIQEILMGESLSSLYLPDAIKDKNTPSESTAKILADDIMADMYATIVAGEAYPMILGRYYLPILLDTMTQPAYSSFVIGSLKIRVAIATLDAMKWKGDAIRKIINDAKDMIEQWEDLSMAIAPKQSGNIYVKAKVVSISQKIKSKKIPEDMIKLIPRAYYPEEEDMRNELQDKLELVKNILIGEPTPTDMAKIWEDGILTPRHLISLLAQNVKDINRNAVLIAMGYHKNILDRFGHQRGKS